MNRFRTELQLASSKIEISQQTPLLTIGSCFSDTIGGRLVANKFTTLVNPFGTVYNPIPLHHLLTRSIEHTYPSTSSYINHRGLWANYEFHSRFNATTQEGVEHQIRDTIDQTNAFLQKARILIITYGSAFIYRRNDTGESVANCHKVPAGNFKKSLLDVNEIVQDFHQLHRTIKLNTNIEQIVVTISPVRHIRDSLEQNSVSKAILRVACQSFTERFTDVTYFPAFEIMMDDLRDYRFYKSDLIHPSDLAEDYLWEKFSGVYFSDETRQLLERWQEISKALQHKPFQPGTLHHRDFLVNTLARLEAIRSFMPVDAEIDQLKSILDKP